MEVHVVHKLWDKVGIFHVLDDLCNSQNPQPNLRTRSCISPRLKKRHCLTVPFYSPAKPDEINDTPISVTVGPVTSGGKICLC